MDWKNKKILVVDDEPDLRELIGFEFEMLGAKITEAASGNKGIQLVDHEKFDAIVTDIRMPDGDGIRLLEHVANKTSMPRHTPIVFISGFADMSFEDAYEQGAEAILTKPFDLRSLVTTIERCLMPWDERIRTPIHGASPTKIFEQTYESVDQARATGDLSLGWGGCFIRGLAQYPYLGDQIRLDLKFRQGKISRIEGVAVARWIRKEHKNTLPPGMGLEFSQLIEPPPAALAEWLKQNKISAFIPKQ